MSTQVTSEILTLREACALYGDKFTVSTLRAEAARGRLDIFRLGKRDYTTREAMQEMVKRCQDEGRRRVSTSMQDEASGLSETDHASSAQAALNLSVAALRQGLPRISGKSTNRSHHKHH